MTDAECFLQYFIGVPFVSGNHIQALRNGDEIFPAMLESIAAATTSINFLTYIYWHGTIAEKFASCSIVSAPNRCLSTWSGQCAMAAFASAGSDL